jgi:hypothetical protein
MTSRTPSFPAASAACQPRVRAHSAFTHIITTSDTLSSGLSSGGTLFNYPSIASARWHSAFAVCLFTSGSYTSAA